MLKGYHVGLWCLLLWGFTNGSNSIRCGCRLRITQHIEPNRYFLGMFFYEFIFSCQFLFQLSAILEADTVLHAIILTEEITLASLISCSGFNTESCRRLCRKKVSICFATSMNLATFCSASVRNSSLLSWIWDKPSSFVKPLMIPYIGKVEPRLKNLLNEKRKIILYLKRFFKIVDKICVMSRWECLGVRRHVVCL